MPVALPAWVAFNLAREELEERITPEYIAYWNRELQQIDHGLALAFVKDVPGQGAITPEEWLQKGRPASGMVRGRWHVRRRVTGKPNSYWPIIGRQGEYREMGSDVIEDFRRRDLWNRQVLRDGEIRQRREDESAERAKQTAKEARVDEIAINVKAQDSPGVLFGDGRWSYRPAGKRGRRG